MLEVCTANQSIPAARGIISEPTTTNPIGTLPSPESDLKEAGHHHSPTKKNGKQRVSTKKSGTNSTLAEVVDKVRSTHSYLFQSREQILDLKQLKDDDFYHLYFLMAKDARQHGRRILATKGEKIAFFLRKLSGVETDLPDPRPTRRAGNFQYDIPPVVLKKPPRPGLANRKKCAVLKQWGQKGMQKTSMSLMNAGTSLRTALEDTILAKYRAPPVALRKQGSLNATQKLEADANRKQVPPLMSIVGKAAGKEKKEEDRIATETAGNNPKQDFDEHKKLIEKYGNKSLSDFVHSEQIRGPMDIARAFEHFEKWRMARFFSQIGPDSFSVPPRPSADASAYVDFLKLNENVVTRIRASLSRVGFSSPELYSEPQTPDECFLPSHVHKSQVPPKDQTQDQHADNVPALSQAAPSPPLPPSNKAQRPVTLYGPEGWQRPNLRTVKVATLECPKKSKDTQEEPVIEAPGTLEQRVAAIKDKYMDVARLAAQCRAEDELKARKSWMQKPIAKLIKSLRKEPRSHKSIDTESKDYQEISRLVMQGDCHKLKTYVKLKTLKNTSRFRLTALPSPTATSILKNSGPSG